MTSRKRTLECGYAVGLFTEPSTVDDDDDDDDDCRLYSAFRRAPLMQAAEQ